MTLTRLRTKISKIDDKIIELIKERNKISENIGKLKKKKGVKIRNKLREKEILNYIFEKTKSRNIKKAFGWLLKESRQIQKKVKK